MNHTVDIGMITASRDLGVAFGLYSACQGKSEGDIANECEVEFS